LPILNTMQFLEDDARADLARRKPGVQIPSPPPPNPAGQSVASLEQAALTAGRGRAAAARASRSPARKALRDQATRLGPLTMTTERGRRLQSELRVRCGARQSGREATLARADGRAVRGYRRSANPGPPGRVAARRSDALHDVTGADTADAERADTDAGHRTSTPGQWTADAWTSHARTLDGHTGHRTPDAWTRPERGQDNLDTVSIRTDILDHHDHSTGRWDNEPWTCGRRLRRSGTMTAQRQ
jgi:hypothetical protein